MNNPAQHKSIPHFLSQRASAFMRVSSLGTPPGAADNKAAVVLVNENTTDVTLRVLRSPVGRARALPERWQAQRGNKKLIDGRKYVTNTEHHAP